MKWTWRDTLSVSIITLVVAAFFFRLFWPTQQIIITPDFGQSDAVSAFSTKVYYSSQLSQYRIPLWTSLIGGGYPIFALGTMAAFFLPNLVFFSFLNTVTAYNVTLVLSLCFMGWGMYVWLRLMKYQRVACLFGSITTVLSGYTIAQLTHITIVQSYSLFPWLAALTLSLANKKSWFTVGWFIILLSQQIFIGFPQCVFITLLFLSAYWIWLMRESVDKGKKTFLFGIAVISGCIAAAVQILPSVEYLKTLVTATGFSLNQAMFFSYPLKHLLTLIQPFALGNPVTGTYPHFSNFEGSIFWENTAYIGIVPLIFLAVYSIVALWKKLRPGSILFFILVLSLAFLLMTGRHSPLYLIYSFWPFNIFRVPSRFIWLFEIALIVLCVHAFDRLIGYVRKTTLLLICIHIVSLFIIWSPYHLLVPAAEWIKSPPLANSIDRDYSTVSIGAERLYNSLNAREKNFSYFLRNTLTPDKGLLWGIPHIGDYTGRSIRRSDVLTTLLNQSITTDASGATISANGRKLLALLSIKNVISTLPLTQQGLLLQKQVSDSGHTIDLYENPDALPNVYFAKQAIPVHTVEHAVEILTSDSSIPGDTVLVEFEATPAATLTRGAVEIKSSGEGHYTVEVTSPNENAILVLTQTYYPGWRATIDGHEVHIFPVNIKHIGILVPQGNHTIEFRYMPDSFIYGAWVSGISLSVTIFLMVFGFFRSLWRTHQRVPARVHRHRRNHDRSRLYT